MDNTRAELVEDHLRRHLDHRADTLRNPTAYAQSQRAELYQAAQQGDDLETRWPTTSPSDTYAGRFIPGTGWIAQ